MLGDIQMNRFTILLDTSSILCCIAEVLSKLEECIKEVRLWLAGNYSELNDDKTYCIILDRKHTLMHINTCAITIGETDIWASESVKTIGVILDKCMKMDIQVVASTTCQSAWFNLYRTNKRNKYLSDSQLKFVIQAFVISNLDQNNALLVGFLKCQISKLQSILNVAAKLIFNYNRYDRVEPPLEDTYIGSLLSRGSISS